MQGGRTIFAGFAGWNADFDQLAVAEQRHFTGSTQEACPVEMRATDGMHLTLGEAGCPGRRTDLVGAFLAQQGLIAIQCVDGFEGRARFLQVGSELVRRSCMGESARGGWCRVVCRHGR